MTAPRKSPKRIALILSTAIVGGVLLSAAACTSDADQADRNISVEAEQFRIERKIIFYNSITDKYMAEVTGRCSVDDSADLSNTLAVTCKVGPNAFTKDYLGKADNVAWFSIQQKPVDVSVYHKEIILKPENIVPDITVETGTQ